MAAPAAAAPSPLQYKLGVKGTTCRAREKHFGTLAFILDHSSRLSTMVNKYWQVARPSGQYRYRQRITRGWFCLECLRGYSQGLPVFVGCQQDSWLLYWTPLLKVDHPGTHRFSERCWELSTRVLEWWLTSLSIKHLRWNRARVEHGDASWRIGWGSDKHYRKHWLGLARCKRLVFFLASNRMEASLEWCSVHPGVAVMKAFWILGPRYPFSSI